MFSAKKKSLQEKFFPYLVFAFYLPANSKSGILDAIVQSSVISYVCFLNGIIMQELIAFTISIFLFAFFDAVNSFSGAFYADNGRQQSILYKTLAKEDKNELREEILNLLGLEHRPSKKGNKRKKLDVQKSSAERYLLDLYKKIEEEDGDYENICRNSACDLLSDSDFIVSFPNKSNYFINNLFYIIRMWYSLRALKI